MLKKLIRKFIIWLLDNDEIREAITQHVEEKLAELKVKLEKEAQATANVDEVQSDNCDVPVTK